MKSFTEFQSMLEGISPVAYHYTNFDNATKILKDNQFRLTPVAASDADEELPSKGMYFMSVSRSKDGDFHSQRKSGVVFVIDGVKLSQNHKGGSVDYFDYNPNVNEYEDRIFSDKPYIKPATRYIKKAHVLIEWHRAERIRWRFEEQAAAFIKTSRSMGIETVVYRNKKAWQLQDERKAIELDATDATDMPSNGQSWEMGASTQMDSFVSLMTKDYTALTSDERDILRQLQIDGERSSSVRELRSAIRDYSRNDTSSRYAHDFMTHMKKFGVRDIRQLIPKLLAKFK